VRKLLDLLYQSEIGKPANFSDLYSYQIQAVKLDRVTFAY